MQIHNDICSIIELNRITLILAISSCFNSIFSFSTFPSKPPFSLALKGRWLMRVLNPEPFSLTFWKGRVGPRWLVHREHICTRCTHSARVGRWSGRTCQAAGQSTAHAPNVEKIVIFGPNRSIWMWTTLPGGPDPARPSDLLHIEPDRNNLGSMLSLQSSKVVYRVLIVACNHDTNPLWVFTRHLTDQINGMSLW